MKRTTPPPMNGTPPTFTRPADDSPFDVVDESIARRNEAEGYIRLAVFWEGEFFCWVSEPRPRNDKVRKLFARLKRTLLSNILKRGDKHGGIVQLATVRVYGNAGRS